MEGEKDFGIRTLFGGESSKIEIMASSGLRAINKISPQISKMAIWGLYLL